MSIAESSLASFGAFNLYPDMTSADVISNMQDVPEGQDSLDPFTYRRLTQLTRRYLELEGSRVIAEYDRYNGIEARKLILDEGKLIQQLEGKTVLVTGGTGLIGSMLMDQISAYNPARLVSISRGVTDPHKILDEAEYYQADIRDTVRLEEIVQAVKPDIIYHVAADKYNHEAEKRAHHTITTNVGGVINIIQAAENAGVSQIVYASTGKAARPFSPDIYASSKKTGEWLMSCAAIRRQMLCSAVRFTHVVDDSNLRKKVNEAIDNDLPVMLQGTDVWMYVQSAYESAQLLLNAGLDAAPGTFKVQAIRDLGEPLNLADIGFGAVAKRSAQVPVYFRGVVAGYEDKAWPFLYGMDAGDYSPLINSTETGQSEVSQTCPQIDSFNLDFAGSAELTDRLQALKDACAAGEQGEVLRGLIQSLSWSMLDARIAKLNTATLKSISNRIHKSQGHVEFGDEHARTNDTFMRAWENLETRSLPTGFLRETVSVI